MDLNYRYIYMYIYNITQSKSTLPRDIIYRNIKIYTRKTCITCIEKHVLKVQCTKYKTLKIQQLCKTNKLL